MTRFQLEPAFVLKAAPYGDTSLLVEALTRAHGRIGLIARGARSARSRPRALLQAFRPLLLSWGGSGDLGSLAGVEPHGTPYVLHGETVFSGWYLNELLLRLLQRHDAHPALFDAYAAALEGLQVEGERALRRFELRLLAELGFGLDLPPDLDPDRHYAWRENEGAMPLVQAVEGSYSGRMLIALRDDALASADDLRAARRLLRAALDVHLGGRGLASARILRELRAVSRPGDTA